MIICQHGIGKASFCTQCEELRVAGKELVKANNKINSAFIKGLKKGGGLMRKVIYSEASFEGDLRKGAGWKVAEKGEGLFHEWGLKAFESGGPATSSAIIELSDGTVKNVPAEHIKFISGEISK